jgi:hypothetical protein
MAVTRPRCQQRFLIPRESKGLEIVGRQGYGTPDAVRASSVGRCLTGPVGISLPVALAELCRFARAESLNVRFTVSGPTGHKNVLASLRPHWCVSAVRRALTSSGVFLTCCRCVL